MVKGIPPNILLLQFGNISNQDLTTQFEKNLSIIVKKFEEGAELILFSYDSIIEFKR